MRGLGATRAYRTYEAVTPLKPAGRWDLLPGGHKVKGASIVARSVPAATVTPYPGYASWNTMWFQWEWAAWIKPQIDLAKSQWGCNTIGIIGTQYGRCPNPVPSGQLAITTADYLARWEQFLAYCRSQGLYVKACLGGDSNNTSTIYGYTPDQTWLQGELTMICGLLAKYADVVAWVDLQIETNGTGYYSSANGIALFRACKAAAPMLRFGYSQSWHEAESVAANMVYDLLEVHTYFNPASASDLDAALQAANVPVVVGEFGQSMDQGTTLRQSRFNTVAGVVNNVTSGRYVAGAMAWSVVDQDIVDTNRYGLADASFNVRADVSTIFAGFPS